VGKQTRTPRGHRRRESAFERRRTQLPRSVHQAKGLMEKMREKAEERLEDMPEPVKRAIDLGETALALMLVPVRFGLHLIRDALEVPAAMLRMLARREA
jgi:hypothetical protein